eukprot:TRINITY_DN46244_c0_g1_i1.p1 TRINITY_DN46244_c0_g1~~TRINITY_DN46244_c0_g1_i1.p1  ORF type:complete len:401 (+),score=71.82 TRINITY_DN46244_c0_g1_i1:75-1277(+)
MPGAGDGANPGKAARKKGSRKKGGSSGNQTLDSRVNFRPYHSVSVPKSVALHELLDDRKPKTTAMLRNIPNRYTQATLLEVIDSAGFEQEYDFFYLPMDTQNRTNVGYCFINFTTPAGLEKFISTFVGFSFNDHSSSKIARVTPAHIQGFLENIRHFSNRAVAQSRNSQYRPIIIHQGIHMDITEAYDLLCSVLGDTEKPSARAAGLQASSAKRPLPPGPTCSQQTLLVPGKVPSIPSRPSSTAKEPQQQEQTQPFGQVLAPSPATSARLMPPSLAMMPMLDGPDSTEDLGGAFCEAKRGFEAAVSMLLQSTRKEGQQVSVPDDAHLQGSLQLPARVTREEDEETVTAGGSRASSVEGSRRCFGRELEDFLKHNVDGADESEAVTPRTNRTLFVHGRISV